MNHPNPERCRELGTFFLIIDGEPTMKEIRMGEASWPNEKLDKNSRHGCGTQACHAGWFGWGCGVDHLVPGPRNGFENDYVYQANKIAQFVGVKNSNYLESWAETNPRLWGNGYGVSMFCGRHAFGENLGEQPTIKQIGIHWLKVADRIEAHEKKA